MNDKPEITNQESIYLRLNEDEIDFLIDALTGRRAYFSRYAGGGKYAYEGIRETHRMQNRLERLKGKLK